MKLGLLTKLLLLSSAIGYVSSQLEYGFTQQIYTAEEGATLVATVVKRGTNTEDFIVSVTPFTFSTFDNFGFLSSGIVRPDPAEFDSERQDFDNNAVATVTFTASSDEQTMNVTIPILEDVVDEATEGFFLLTTVSDLSSETDRQNSDAINSGIALITIMDNDDLFFFFNQSTTFEVAEPNGTRAFNDIAAVIKNGTSERTVVVNVNAENNTALQGLDFEHAEGFQLTFAPLVTSQGVSITIIDDQIVEPNERFLLSLEAPNDESPYFIGMPSTLRVGITDTDAAVIGFERSSYQVSENTSVMVTVALLQPASTLLDNSVRFSYILQTNSITASGGGVDFTDLMASGTITSQSISDTFTISIVADMIDENNEEFTVTATRGGISIGSFTIQPSEATITIQEDGAPNGGGMGGDPHFSILLPNNKLLCFSVQGEPGFNFNLISNDFLQLNGLFISDPSRQGVTWIGAMGLTVKGSKYKQLNDTKIRFMAEEEIIYLGNEVKLYPQRVKTIKLSHGSLTCSEREDEYSGPLNVFVDLEDVGLQFTVKFVKAKHIDVVWNKVMRQPRNSHGLIGQFLRAGIDIDETRQLLLLPNMPPVPVMSRQVWRFMERDVPEKQVCWMAMNWGNQGKGLIEGHYLEYSVSDILASDSMSKKTD